jgi:microcystin-dependent protein
MQTSYNVAQNPNDGINGVVPVGSVIMWSMPKAPEGWLACDGNTVSRTTYAVLFSIIGITYGAGDGSTTFKLPDTTGRTIRGLGGSFSPIGFNGGDDLVSLVQDNIPRHNHPITDPGHTHSFIQNVYNGDVPGGAAQYQGNGQDTPGTPNAYVFETGLPAGTREFTNINQTDNSVSDQTDVNVVNAFLTLNFIIKSS